MELVTNITDATCITHSGTMHSDEVFATAFLDLYKGNIKVFRTTNIPNDLSKDVLVYDIGRGIFDHHQLDAEKRENGITYSSFGLLWKSFGKDFLSQRMIEDIEEVFNLFEKDLVEGIDADDNGVFPKIEANYKVKTLSDIIKLFNPAYKSNQNEQIQFIKAVEFAKIIIEEELTSVIGKAIAKKQVLASLANKENHTLYLDEYMPYEQTLLQDESSKDIYFVVYPSNRGGYGIKTVPISLEDHTKRKDFPEEWAGLENEELERVSNIKGLTFCHTTRFLVSCDSKETASLVIKTVLDKEKTNECLAKTE